MLDENTKKKNKKIKSIVSIVMVAMVGFMVWLWVNNANILLNVAQVSDDVATKQSENYRYISKEYKVTKNDLDVTTNRLAEVAKELEAANVELSATRGELVEIQALNDQLKGDIQALERYKAAAMEKGEALEAMINTFKQKNKELDHDLQSVRKELAVFQPDIDNVEEGRSKVLLFKNHIRMVKKNMKVIRIHAAEIRNQAQKERDRLETLYGNNGFLVKDGQDKSVTSFDQKKIDIDVKFVNP